MLYQCNLLASALLVPLCFIFLVKYVQINAETIFFWAEKDCDHSRECLDQYFNGGPTPHEKGFIDLLRDNYLDPPPEDLNTDGFSIYTPVWRKLVDWYHVQENLKDVWENQPPGYFVEVGAVDGDFMSETIYLEKNLSWTGLLIEPDPRSYKLLRESKRNAWTSPMCVALEMPCKKSYWLRTLEDDLPYHFQQILLARSKLNVDTMVGDEERGSPIWVLCAPLSSLLMAANVTQVDMLSIATGHDEDEKKIRDVIMSKTIDVKTLLIQFPTSRFYQTTYPEVTGYVIDMEHSQLLIKLYVKVSHCQLIQRGTCKKMKYYDSVEACVQYFCFNHLTVWTYDTRYLPSTKNTSVAVTEKTIDA